MRRVGPVAGWVALLLLAGAVGHRAGAMQERKRVLLIGIDGVRVDVLAAAHTPNLDALIVAGAFTDSALASRRTVSGPGWSSMLTGVSPEKHGVLSNDFGPNRYAEYPDFLTRLERLDTGWHTLAVADWPPLLTTADGGPLIGDAVDDRILFDGDSLGYAAADDSVTAAAAARLARADVHAAFVYLGNVDVVGHDTGSLSAEYRAAIEAADAQVGRLMAALRARPDYRTEDWLVLVSTDHGRRDGGGHGGITLQERTIFFLASGPSAERGRLAAGVRIVDVAASALAHLGVRADPGWLLDGTARGLRR